MKMICCLYKVAKRGILRSVSVLRTDLELFSDNFVNISCKINGETCKRQLQFQIRSLLSQLTTLGFQSEEEMMRHNSY